MFGPGELQMVRVSAIDCLTVYRINYTDMYFLCYHRSVQRKKGTWVITEISAVIYGRIRTCYLCFLLHLSLPLVWFERSKRQSVYQITNQHSHLVKPFLFLELEQYSPLLCPRKVSYDKLQAWVTLPENGILDQNI